jgi:hypothetical protein
MERFKDGFSSSAVCGFALLRNLWQRSEPKHVRICDLHTVIENVPTNLCKRETTLKQNE